MPPQRDPRKPHSRYGPNRGRDREAETVYLPLEHGYEVPPLPKGREWSESEKEMWQDLWESPQASQWIDSVVPTVATYVVLVGQVLAGTANGTVAKEARQMADALGLTPSGMATLGWRLESNGE